MWFKLTYCVVDKHHYTSDLVYALEEEVPRLS